MRQPVNMGRCLLRPVSSLSTNPYPLPRGRALSGTAASPQFRGLGHVWSDNIQTSNAFYPAKPIPFFIRSFQHLVSGLVCRPLGFRAKIDNPELMKTLKQQPNGMVMALNHSSLADSLSLQMFGKQAGLTPVTLASLAMFDSHLFQFPLKLAWPVASRLGLLSINEANPTMAQSKVFARKTLEQRKYPLAIFPEGRVNWNSSQVAPCRTGAMEFAVQAATANRQNVTVVPIGITYQYSPKAEKQARKRLFQLEQYARRLHRGKNVKSQMMLPALKNLPDNPSLQQRIDRLLDWVLTREEQTLDIPNPQTEAGGLVKLRNSVRIEAIRNRQLAQLTEKYPIPQLKPGEQGIPKLYRKINDLQLHNQKPALWVMLNPWSRQRKAYLAQFKALQADMRQLKTLEILESCQAAEKSTENNREQAGGSLQTDITRQMEALNRLHLLVRGQQPGVFAVMRNCTAIIHIGNPIAVNPLPNASGSLPSEEVQKDHVIKLTRKLQEHLQSAVQHAQQVAMQATPTT